MFQKDKGDELRCSRKVKGMNSGVPERSRDELRCSRKIKEINTGVPER